MSQTPPAGTVLGKLSDLPDPSARASDWSDGAVILVHRGGKVTAWLNECPHALLRLSLTSGKVLLHKDGFIVCPIHGASFESDSGACAGGPAGDDGLTAVAVKIVGGDVVAG
jgi:nitrite reductase/ring-hydroxylating ferredoxin subunit